MLRTVWASAATIAVLLTKAEKNAVTAPRRSRLAT